MSVGYILAGYVVLALIAVVLLAILAIVTFWSERSGLDKWLFKWVFAVCLAGTTFDYLIRKSRRLWHERVFWVSTTALFVVSVAGIALLISHFRTVEWLWYAILMLVTYPFVEFVTQWSVRKFGSHQ